MLYISTSQSDEISAKPDTSPITFHEALNPTITCRVMGKWAAENLGKKWWIVYADYAWGKQCNAVLHGGAPEGGRHAARRHPVSARQRRVLRAPAEDPGRQARRVHERDPGCGQYRAPQAGDQLRHEEDHEDRAAPALDLLPQGGRGRALPGRPRRHQLVLGAAGLDPVRQEVRRRLDEEVQPARPATTARTPTAACSRWRAAWSWPSPPTPTRSRTRSARARPTTTSRASSGGGRCDNKSFQDLWIVKGGATRSKGDWGLMDVVAKVGANEEYDRTCKEKGLA